MLSDDLHEVCFPSGVEFHPWLKHKCNWISWCLSLSRAEVNVSSFLNSGVVLSLAQIIGVFLCSGNDRGLQTKSCG